MLNVAFFIICLSSIKSQVSASSNNTDSSVATGLWQSFLKFKDNVQSFFHIDTEQLEQRRQQLKKAFLKFIMEAFRAEENCKITTPLAVHMRDQLTINDTEPPTTTPKTTQEYKSESHNVLTADGYLLTLHRILPATEHTNRKLVLFHHGLLGSSEDWLLLGPDVCLPCMLSKLGYDVWLTNARGNRYSKLNINKTAVMPEFWDFSFHEIGLLDLSAVTHYILEYTNGESEMHFIGHSMGATALLVLLSALPYHNELFKSAILLAPLAFMHSAKGLMRMLADAHKRNDLNYLNILEKDEFTTGVFPRQVIEKICNGNERSCSNPLLLLVNGGEDISDAIHMKNILNHMQVGGSTKTIIHYGQLVTSGNFQMFDYGPTKNLERYGDYNPHKYNLNNVTLPVTIFSSRDDWLSTTDDVKTLLRDLPNVISHQVIRTYGFSHTDFVWALDAPNLIYFEIIEIYKQFKGKP